MTEEEVLLPFTELPRDDDPRYVNAMMILAQVLSPHRSGIYDELLALIETTVAIVQPNGMVNLAQNWWSSVDILFLDDIWQHGGMAKDKAQSHYGVPLKMARMLRRHWKRVDEVGWALQSHPQNIVFEWDEFDQWRVAYEAQQQTTSDGVYGIGRFD